MPQTLMNRGMHENMLRLSKQKQSPVMMSSVTTAEGTRLKLEDLKFSRITDIWDNLVKECPDNTAIVDDIHGEPAQYTFKELRQLIIDGAGALQSLGLEKGDCVSMFSENSHRWLVLEQAIMKAGGCNAVRGATAPVGELQYIYENSNSVGVVVEKPALLKSIAADPGLKSAKAGAMPKFAIVLFAKGKSGEEIKAEMGLPAEMKVVTYKELLAMKRPLKEAAVDPDDPAALVYTSGTTSYPKGVVLRHSNLLHQVHNNSFNRANNRKYDPWVGDVFVSILPCWHIFERTAEYYTLSRGAKLVYSNIRNFKTDLVKYKPHFLIAVPRLFETIYKGVQQNFSSQKGIKKKLVTFFTASCMLYMKAKRVVTNMVIRQKAPDILEKAWAALTLAVTWPLAMLADKMVWSKVREGLGGRMKVMVSGGSSLSPVLEDFYEMIGGRVIVGYGLTETSPVIANRVAEHNLVGSVGKPPPNTQIKVVDVETRKELPIGEKGLILARGPQIMREYMSNPEATREAIDDEGFFNTGDLGMVNPPTGDIVITGRAKDTIVLSNGENIAPQPIEDLLIGNCATVDQMMLVGQDERFLSALAIVSPSGLESQGLITKDHATRLNNLLGATPLTTGIAGTAEEMEKETKILQEDPAIQKAVLNEIKKESKKAKLRPWENVQDVRVLLEPFTMTNGLLTQTLKVKKNVATDRFEPLITDMYKEDK